MSPIHPSKRRRLHTATTTLAQPFKSPFKSSPTPKPPPAASSSSSPPPPPPTNPQTPSPPTNPTHHTPRPTSRPAPPPTPHRLALQSHHTRLLTRLAAARAALETSSQAQRLESGDRRGELEGLVGKWKGKSREAAEEVFAVARDRVNRCGGVGGLRDRERGRGRGWGWDERGEGEGGGGGGDDGSEGAGARDDVESVDEREEGAEGMGPGEKGEGADEEEEEEGGYTMDMMLKSLNVDLGVIGFDRALQKWVD